MMASSSLFNSRTPSRRSLKSTVTESLAVTTIATTSNDVNSSTEGRLSEGFDSDKVDSDGADRLSLVPNSGECRLFRAINEALGCNSRRCSTGCFYSMEEIVPTGYLLMMDEQNRAWFRMHLAARNQSVQLWFADFTTRLQESLDDAARLAGLFSTENCHVFAAAKQQSSGAQLHCRKFTYLPREVLRRPGLMLHHLPIGPDQLLIVDHVKQAAAHVLVTVGVTKDV